MKQKILEGEARHIQDEFKLHHKLLTDIYQPSTWKKLLTSRIVTWVAGPLLAGTIIMTAILFSRKAEIEALQKVVDNPQSIALAMTEGTKTMRETESQLKTIKIIAGLLQIPESTMRLRGEQLLIRFPSESAVVTTNDGAVVLRFNIPEQTRQTLIKHAVEQKNLGNHLEEEGR